MYSTASTFGGQKVPSGRWVPDFWCGGCCTPSPSVSSLSSVSDQIFLRLQQLGDFSFKRMFDRPQNFILTGSQKTRPTYDNLTIIQWVFVFVLCIQEKSMGPRWQSGNSLTSHLWGRGSIPSTASSGKAGSCLPLVGSLQYRTLTNCMYWFPLPFQLPIMIWPVQRWKRRKTPNK